MKSPTPLHKTHAQRTHQGFALVATISLMVMLVVLAVGLLGLSAVTLRSDARHDAQTEARANARLALMVAIGELQKEMGSDMRVSAESALFDANQETEAIDGLAQSRWLAAYDSWGDWLNTSYTPPAKPNVPTIADTYGPRREKMFRRWLLSMPQGEEKDIEAPNSLASWNNSNSVVLVGKGSLGADVTTDQVTRAYLTPVGETGRYAWWISPENHKARIDKAKNPRTLETDEWQTAQGDTAEVGVGGLDGLEKLDQDATISDRLITTHTLRAAEIGKEKNQQHFFDLTAHSQGVLASVRTGHLKKDLSLLFEKDNAALPAGYKFTAATDVREPSIRPMSPELVAKNPKIPMRHFQSWTQMRNFYRIYRTSSDATVAGTSAAAVLRTTGTNRWTEFASVTGLQSVAANTWKGSNAYMRVPVVAKITFIHSLMSQFVSTNRYRLFLVYSPVYTLWNPYSVELRIPDNKWTIFSAAYRIWPFAGQMYAGTTPIGGLGNLDGGNVNSPLRSGTGGDIVFKPGEFRVFSHSTLYQGSAAVDLVPGFDPQAIGGQRMQLPAFPLAPPPSTAARLWAASDNPGYMTTFSYSIWGGNVNNGNTPGSLDLVNGWQLTPTNNVGLTSNYQIDWLKKDQCFTPITKADPNQLARFSFADGNPVPVGYHQLVIKGLSKYDYESINWGKDWRCRNWIQSPPFYFGSALYASENDKILHTQRIDCPYAVNFGPTSMSEIPKLVFHNGTSAFLGSGSNPFEKVSSVAVLELPTAPVGSLAGFAGMRINPGWANAALMNPAVTVAAYNPPDIPTRLDTKLSSMSSAYHKAQTYQSGITGPGIGNSFLHPMIPRNDVYQFFDNSWSQDPLNRQDPLGPTQANNNLFYNDYWDHVFLLNDALWDDYFVSSLADQTRPGTTVAASLGENIDRVVAGGEISNSRYFYEPSGKSTSKVKADLQAVDGYLKTANHLMVDGMFNVNSTSVAAWYSLFAGIRERKVVYRDRNGQLQTIAVPNGKKVALARFDTEVSDQEMDDPEFGATMPDGSPGWSGVRFLDDAQLHKLAEECVKQVKKRGPFLNFSEFINRRLSDDALGTMGALQSAIDYDDAGPQEGSINYNFKNGPDFMIKESDLGDHAFQAPEAAVGSRFAGIPGYVIQSDLLKPIANTLAVRDDTFRIRAYGESRNSAGNVIARAWCEAIVQRTPEYIDSSNDASVPARLLDLSGGTSNPINNKYGTFTDNLVLTSVNRTFGRKFRIQSFRWLDESEI